MKFEFGNIGTIVAVTLLLGGGFFIGKATAPKNAVCISTSK